MRERLEAMLRGAYQRGRAALARLKAGGGRRHWRRRLLKGLLVGVPFLIVGGGLLGFSPLVKSRVAARASAAGFDVQIGSVRPGWGRIWLEDVRLSPTGVGAVDVHLAAIRVDLAPFSIEGAHVTGGRVVVRGSSETVLEQLRAWQRARPKSAAGTAGGGGRSYSAQGIDLSWSNGPGGGAHHVWGLRCLREGATEACSADLVRLELDGSGLSLFEPALVLERVGGERKLSRFKAKELRGHLQLGAAPSEPEGNAAAAGAGPGGGAAAGGAGPSSGAFTLGLAGLAGASSVDELRRLLQRLQNLAEERFAKQLEVDIAGVRLRIQEAAQTLNLGPGRLRLWRDAAADTWLSFVPGAENQKTPLTLKARLPASGGPFEVELKGGPVSLGSLGVKPGDFGLIEVDRARIDVEANLSFSTDTSDVEFTGGGRFENVSLHRPAIARQPIHGLAVGWSGAGTLALGGQKLRVDHAELRVGKVKVELAGELDLSDEHVAADVTLGIPLASCQDMLDSSPEGLLPLLAGMRMTGTFSMSAGLKVDTRKIADTETKLKLANACRITHVPADVAPERFFSIFSYEARDADGRALRIYSGPGTPSWVPHAAFSRYLQTALLVNEDGRFFHHDGFDREAIANSVRQNIQAGRFVRGGSTISMQLAKNVYLKREKTLSRKLQEAVLTLLLEQELSKQQILELYLNVIEFGPGIYGIGPAAQHYFDSVPAELTLGQAMYLGSILPRPQVSHFQPDGQLRPRWAAYLRQLMSIAHKRKLIDDEELEAGLKEELRFGEASTGSFFGAPAPAPDDGGYYDGAALGP